MGPGLIGRADQEKEELRRFAVQRVEVEFQVLDVDLSGQVQPQHGVLRPAGPHFGWHLPSGDQLVVFALMAAAVVLLIALADAFGFVGIIIAPLLSIVCQILWNRLIKRRTKTGAANLLSDLQERMAHLRETVNEMEEPHSPVITNSIERITNLLNESEPVLKAVLMVDE